VTLALSFRVIHERNYRLSMEMSFFISFPISNALPGPDKSGHRAPYCIIVRSALPVCPDLRGTLRPPGKGNEIKKDISMLLAIASFLGDLSFSGLRRGKGIGILVQAKNKREMITVNSETPNKKGGDAHSSPTKGNGKNQGVC